MAGRTERPLARAAAHLSAGRIAEAKGAYNAILTIDPNDIRAHLGLADCANVEGRREAAVTHLVSHAQRYASQRNFQPAFTLMTKALAIAPDRLELHIDVAELEATAGRFSMAAKRLENLARSYAANGNAEEAEMILLAAADFRATPPPPPPPRTARKASRAPFIEPEKAPARLRKRSSAPPPPPRPSGDFITGPGAPMVRPSPLTVSPSQPVQPKRETRRGRRGAAAESGPRWQPSMVGAERTSASAARRPPATMAQPRSASRGVAARPRPSATVQPAPKPARRAAAPRPSAVITPAPKPARRAAAKPRPSATVQPAPKPARQAAAPRPSAVITPAPKPARRAAAPRPSAVITPAPKPARPAATPRRAQTPHVSKGATPPPKTRAVGKASSLASRLRRASKGRDFAEDESTQLWHRPATR